MYALLLLGGSSVSVNQILGGITIRTSRSIVKLAAGPKIGILVNQLRYVCCRSRETHHSAYLSDGFSMLSYRGVSKKGRYYQS